MICIIAYDISKNKIRRKVENLLKEKGIRVNYSVFECRFENISERDDLILEIRGLIKSKDSVRVYTICNACLKKTLEIGRYTDCGYIIEG